MNDYIPTTEEVRDEYSFHCEGWCERCNESDGVSYLFHEAEFDRWLAKVKAQAISEFVREQNAEHRKTLGRIMYAVID